jgi:hypothetical protein
LKLHKILNSAKLAPFSVSVVRYLLLNYYLFVTIWLKAGDRHASASSASRFGKLSKSLRQAQQVASASSASRFSKLSKSLRQAQQKRRQAKGDR